MIVYADTSFLLSLYIPDVNSAATRSVSRNRCRFLLTPFHELECASAVLGLVFRRALTPKQGEAALAAFAADWASEAFLLKAWPVEVFSKATRLATRYAAGIGARTLDILHVAVAIELGAERFLTFDRRQAQLAATAGLTTGPKV